MVDKQMGFVHIRVISLAKRSNNTYLSENMGVHFLRREKKKKQKKNLAVDTILKCWLLHCKYHIHNICSRFFQLLIFKFLWDIICIQKITPGKPV